VKKDEMEQGREVRWRIPGTPIFCSMGEENAVRGRKAGGRAPPVPFHCMHFLEMFIVIEC
jgi:hypothetical protein